MVIALSEAAGRGRGHMPLGVSRGGAERGFGKFFATGNIQKIM